MATRKRAHAQDLAQSICDANESDQDFVRSEDIETWSNYDLYEWLEAWGYEWDDINGWVNLEDIDYPDDDPVSMVDFL